MEYSCYKDAFDAVVKDNDGVLPDLYEVFNFIISGRPSNLQSAPTVAEIVAYALIEMSERKVANPIAVPSLPSLLYVAASEGEPLYLDKLLDQASASLN